MILNRAMKTINVLKFLPLTHSDFIVVMSSHCMELNFIDIETMTTFEQIYWTDNK